MNRQTGRIKNTVMMALFGAAAFGAFAGDNDPYIESDGASSVNTGYRMKLNSRIEVDYQWLGTPKDMLFGAWDSGAKLSTGFWIHSGNGAFSFLFNPKGGYGTIDTSIVKDNNRHTAVIDIGNANFRLLDSSGSVQWSGTTSLGDNPEKEAAWPVVLFGVAEDANGTGKQCSSARIYSVKISETENGEERLIHDLVPCRKGDDAGFYDKVTGAVFFEQGSGRLVAGGDGVVAIQEDGYIETPADNNSSKHLSFNTGYCMKLNSRLEVDFQWLGTPEHLLFGAWNEDAKLSTGFWILNGKYNFLFSPNGKYVETETPNDTSIARDNYRHIAVIDIGSQNANFRLLKRSGFVQWSKTTSLGDNPEQEAVWPVVLFGAAADANGTGKQFSYARIFSAKFYEGDNPNPVKAFVPYVKDGVAGFMETVSGEFTPTSGMSYGGAIQGRTDAYVESDGNICLNLGYKANMRSRIEMDFQSIDAKGNCLCGAWQYGSLRYTFWVTGGKKWAFIFHGKNLSDPQYYPDSFSDEDENRHTVVMDMKNKQISIVTDCVTNWTQVAAADTFNESDESSYPMGVFGNINNTAGTVANMMSKARVYSVRIYEDDVLKHEFLPCKDGDTVSLYDTVDKKFAPRTSASMLWPSIAGKGVDGEEKWLVEPQDATVGKSKSVTLKALAVGAVSYRWTCNGEAVAGGSNGELVVDWRDSKTPDVYAVTPVYNVIIGSETIETTGEAKSVTIDYARPYGLMIIFR